MLDTVVKTVETLVDLQSTRVECYGLVSDEDGMYKKG